MNVAARVLAAVILLAGCAASRPAPAVLQAGTPCSHCRMIVSDQRVAAQIVAPGEDPLFFDDIGCLTAFLREHPPGRDAAVYVADHASGAWIDAREAVYSRSDALTTPMGSHIVAHRDAAARDADPAVRNASSLMATDVLGPAAEAPREP